MRLAPGTILRGKYQIVGELDGSGDGEVYEARELVSGAHRAVKVFREVVPPSAAWLDDLRRATMAASSGVGANDLGHPGIARVFDLDTTPEGSPFLVTELLRGQTLARLIAAGPIALSDVAIIIEAIALPLDDAHRRGLFHGELTPEAVFVLDAGADTHALVKLLGFGVAGMRPQLGGGAAHATPFLAPERHAGRQGPIDARGDVYSLGAIAHAMITVAPPPVAAAVTRAMNREPAARYGSVLELARALRMAVSPARVSGVTPTPAPAAARRSTSQAVPAAVPHAPTDRVVAPASARKLVATAVGGALAIALAVLLIPRRAHTPPPARPTAAQLTSTAPPPTPAPVAPSTPPAVPAAPPPATPPAAVLPLPAPAPAIRRPRSAHAGMSEAAKKEMKESYQKATRAFDLRNFDEAIEAYKHTYELGGDAPMLYNIAQALRLSQRSDEAVLYYRRYLARAPKAKNRDEVLGRITELTTKPESPKAP
jgi:serine/threonine-protein kinase